jgi:putative ABC transport system ATP-binding protein
MIELDGVSKMYAGGVTALESVDLQIGQGEMVMVVGPSGSGKSTLLFTVGAMLRPTTGAVKLGDTNVYRLSGGKRAALRRQRLGFMFQTFNLVPYLDCLDNVALPATLDGRPRAASIERARAMLARLGMSQRLHHRPEELSVGERQRVALCRSLVNDPDVLLADEPTGNLDGALTAEVIDLLREANRRGQTIVMATHDTHVAELGTRVIGLDNGQVVFDRAPRAKRRRKEKGKRGKRTAGARRRADLPGGGAEGQEPAA